MRWGHRRTRPRREVEVLVWVWVRREVGRVFALVGLLLEVGVWSPPASETAEREAPVWVVGER